MTVLIKLWIDGGPPPQGTAEFDGGTCIPFAGWLELLSVLNEEVVEHADGEKGEGT